MKDYDLDFFIKCFFKLIWSIKSWIVVILLVIVANKIWIYYVQPALFKRHSIVSPSINLENLNIQSVDDYVEPEVSEDEPSIPYYAPAPVQSYPSTSYGISHENDTYENQRRQRNERLYNDMYQRQESVVQNYYNSLTSHGFSTQSNSGIYSGSSGNLSSTNSSAYIQLKSNFLQAQRRLREIRNEAAREGITITASQFETTTVY